MAHLPPTSPSRRRSHVRTVAEVLALVAFAGVAAVSFLPQHDKNLLHTRGRLHDPAHFALFAVLGLLATRVSRSGIVQTLLVTLAMLFGITIELAQNVEMHVHFRVNAPVEWTDVLLDCMGVLSGALAGYVASQVSRGSTTSLQA